MSGKTNRGLRYACDVSGKLLPCVTNYTLKITTIEHKPEYNHDIIDVVRKSVYQ